MTHATFQFQDKYDKMDSRFRGNDTIHRVRSLITEFFFSPRSYHPPGVTKARIKQNVLDTLGRTEGPAGLPADPAARHRGGPATRPTGRARRRADPSVREGNTHLF